MRDGDEMDARMREGSMVLNGHLVSIAIIRAYPSTDRVLMTLQQAGYCSPYS